MSGVCGWKRLMILMLYLAVGVTTVPAATQWWDSSASGGLQHGSGAWSTNAAEAFWASVAGGNVPGPWTNGNDATFAAIGGVSTVGVNGAVTAGLATFSGNGYCLLADSGAALSGSAMLVSGTNNGVSVTAGGRIELSGALTVNAGNSLSLAGGTLAVGSGVQANGLPLAVGDGIQAATLRVVGGTLVCSNGVLVASNGTLQASGSIDGGPLGVTLTNGATLTVGAAGAGVLMVAGSNLVWREGACYVCDVTNLNAGPGLGWDWVKVGSQLVLDGTNLLIRMDSLGASAVGFSTNADYSLRILSYGSQSGYTPAGIMVDSSAFLEGTTGWSVSNAAGGLYLVYRGAAPAATPTYTWAVPSNGNWSVGANWVGGVAPSAGGAAECILRFGDNGTPYTASNDLAGSFLLNQLQIDGVSPGLTNQLRGGLLVFTNNGETAARIDLLSGVGGTFVISNRVRLTTDTTCGGNALSGVVSLNGVVTNLASLRYGGLWTLALGGANELGGTLIVDSPGGILKPSGPYPVNVLNGSGSILVSNGMIQGVTGQADALTFANAKHNRQALIRGAGSIWSNSYSLTIANNATNVGFVVDGGRLYENNGAFFVAGAKDGTFTITNGGQAVAFGNNLVVGDAATNCQFAVSGVDSQMRFNQDLVVAANAGLSNRVIVEQGGLLAGGNNFDLQVGSGSTGNQYVVREGGVVRPNALHVRGVRNSGLVTGAGTLVAQTGSSPASVGVGEEAGNMLTIADSGMVSNMNLQMAVGGAYSNRLVVTNGGKLFTYATAPYIAYGTTNRTFDNTLTVTGTGSVWDVKGQTLFVCAAISNYVATGNGLVIQDGGVVTNIATLVMASGAAASNNTVTVDGGRLYMATISVSNDLPNRFTLSGGGQVTPGFFVATNANFDVVVKGGVLNLKNSLFGNGLPQAVGGGSQSATLNILPGGTNVFASGLVITNAGSLAGSGLIAATSTVWGTLSPGSTGIGGLTNRGPFTLSGDASARFDVATNTSAGVGWDLLAVTNGPLTLGGTLTVLLTGGFVPTNTQRFTIMTNPGPASVSGFFANVLNGSVPAYTNEGGRPVGFFKVTIGPQDVALGSFSTAGLRWTLLLIR